MPKDQKPSPLSVEQRQKDATNLTILGGEIELSLLVH